MATVLVALTRDTPTGRERVAGTLKWEPTSRRTVGEELVLPQGFTVALPAAGDWLAVEVPPSGLGWCWRVTERIPGGGGIVRYVLVPDEPAVAYADLPDVDPATLDPAGSPNSAANDTGWRTITSPLVNGWTVAYPLRLRRIGSRVTLRATNLKGGSISVFLPAMPAGFAPVGYTGFVARPSTTVPTPLPYLSIGPDARSTVGSETHETATMEVSWLTDDAWPTVLPGTAA